MDAALYFERLKKREVRVLLDDERATTPLTSRGFVVEPLDTYDFSQAGDAPALVVVTQMSSVAKLHALWGTSATLFCHLALAKFDGSSGSLAYALDQLLSVDHVAALERRAEHYEKLFSSTRVEARTGSSTLHFHIQDEVEVANCGTILEPGVLYSAFEFFEASLVNLEGERSTFWVEGKLEFDALIQLSNTAEQKARFGADLDDFVRRAARGTNVLEFVDNRLSHITVGGSDVTEAWLAMMAGEERGVAATEFGLGCADVGLPEELGTNAVLHKARRGVYVGIGKGHIMPHVDFVAKGANVTFVGAT